MKRALLLIAIGSALLPGALPADPPRPADAAVLENWMSAQQFANPALPSDGGIKIHPRAATTSEGQAYYRVSPYFANLGVLGLLRSRSPGAVDLAARWIRWYFAHLNPASAPAGVPDEHFYLADGSGETTCLKPGDPHFCHYNDATDSAAATFFSVLAAAREAGLPAAILDTPERRSLVRNLADTLLKLQQGDGLCWAKNDYRVEYLEDNCEVFAGLRDLAKLEREAFHDPAQSDVCQAAAERVQHGILHELYDADGKLYAVAKFENGRRPPPDPARWQPDTQAQFWPHLFGVVSPADPKTSAILSAVNAHWNGQAKPDWAASPDQINGGWIEAGCAFGALLAGDAPRVRTYLAAVKRLKFPKPGDPAGFEWPFSIAEAGWLLQIVTQIPD